MKPYRSIVKAVCYLFSITPLLAQEPLSNTIGTNRPTQTVGPGIVHTGMFQFESGIGVAGARGSDRYSAQVPGLMVRYGLAKAIDLFATGQLIAVIDPVPEHSAFGNGTPSLGAKVRLYGTEKWKVVTLANVEFPTLASAEFRGTEKPVQNVTLSGAYSATGDLVYILNAGITTTEGSDPLWRYTGFVSKSLTEKLRLYGETYGLVANSELQAGWGAGFYLLLTNDLQMDLGGLSEIDGQGYSVTLGLSYRFVFDGK